jgi:FlaA1/EpsC-like NDP-sugar epimerase
MEVLSLRQSNREVAKGINYSDVLVVAQKSGKHLLKDTHQTPFKPFERKELNSLLNLNYEVYDHLIRDIRSSIKSSEENDENVVFFGLSSYAFRIFHSLHLSGQLEKISGFFDSDTRLHEYSVGPIQIGGLEELIAFQEKQSNKLLKILVAAVKYEGIVEMLNKELGSFNYVVNRV